MKTKKFLALMAVVFFQAAFFFMSCQKEVSVNKTGFPAGKQDVTIYMNDDPAG